MATGCVGDISRGPDPQAGDPDSKQPPGIGPGGGSGGSEPRPPGSSAPSPAPSERPAAAEVQTTRFARLSHEQWENTVRDLLRLPAAPGLAAKFSSDVSGTFGNDGESLAVSDSLRTDYQTAAEVLSLKVTRDPALLGRLAPAGSAGDLQSRGQAFVRSFGLRAYRRPLDDAEVTAYGGLFAQGPAVLPGVEPFAAGAQLVIEAMLQSPHFLYRTELTTGSGRVRLGAYEIAAKLSYALASTMPDDELFAAAAADRLATHAQVSAQAERLLGRGAGPSETFHRELFQLDGLDVEKDAKVFPEWKPAWLSSITQESRLFLGEIFGNGRGLAELFTAPFTFVDATLAPLYGVKAPAGGGFARVELDAGKRAGFLTQIAFLAKDGLSDPEPIRRGAFINHALLCLDLVPPPGATEDAPDPPAGARTNRERVTAVTSAPLCASCHHGMINPAGFAFENYDAIGRWRDTENGVPINASDTYAFASGAKSFKNAIEFSARLAESPEVHECYTRNWFKYLHGRGARPQDDAFVKWLAERSLRQRDSLKSLAVTIVTDDGFLTRLP